MEKMRNKEYAEEMRKAADNWMDIMPVTKKLWLEIADRIEASPDSTMIRQENRKNDCILESIPGTVGSLFRRLFYSNAAEEKPKELKPFDWGDLT